jgi:hypothetical protein
LLHSFWNLADSEENGKDYIELLFNIIVGAETPGDIRGFYVSIANTITGYARVPVLIIYGYIILNHHSNVFIYPYVKLWRIKTPAETGGSSASVTESFIYSIAPALLFSSCPQAS